MGTELSPMASVQEKIKAKIKEEFVSLLPDEVWSEMVRAVITDFTTDKKKDEYGRNAPRPSPLKEIIQTELRAIVNEQLKGELNKLGNGPWIGSKQAASEAVKKLVATSYQEILESIQRQQVENIVLQAVSQLRASDFR